MEKNAENTPLVIVQAIFDFEPKILPEKEVRAKLTVAPEIEIKRQGGCRDTVSGQTVRQGRH